MTAERIAEIYVQLGQAVLTIDATPERGPQYLQEQLHTCRRMQDEITQVHIEVQRAFAGVKRSRRAARALVVLTKRHPESVGYVTAQSELDALEGTYDDLQALLGSVAVARGNLRATDSDIRLSAMLMDQQIRLGQVRPPAAAAPLVSVTPTAPEPIVGVEVPADDLQRFYESLSK